MYMTDNILENDVGVCRNIIRDLIRYENQSLSGSFLNTEPCCHDFVEDWIDIDPDRSHRIVYCRKCEMTQESEKKLNKKPTAILKETPRAKPQNEQQSKYNQITKT
jgi:hypothetical protein